MRWRACPSVGGTGGISLGLGFSLGGGISIVDVPSSCSCSRSGSGRGFNSSAGDDGSGGSGWASASVLGLVGWIDSEELLSPELGGCSSGLSTCVGLSSVSAPSDGGGFSRSDSSGGGGRPGPGSASVVGEATTGATFGFTGSSWVDGVWMLKVGSDWLRQTCQSSPIQGYTVYHLTESKNITKRTLLKENVHITAKNKMKVRAASRRLVELHDRDRSARGILTPLSGGGHSLWLALAAWAGWYECVIRLGNL